MERQQQLKLGKKILNKCKGSCSVVHLFVPNVLEIVFFACFH